MLVEFLPRKVKINAFSVQFKTKCTECSVEEFCCFMTMLAPILLVSLAISFKYLVLEQIDHLPYSLDLGPSDYLC